MIAQIDETLGARRNDEEGGYLFQWEGSSEEYREGVYG